MSSLINGWELIPHKVFRSEEGHEASRFGAIPSHGSNWKIVDTGKWTLYSVAAGVTRMGVPFESKEIAISWAKKNSAPRISYGD